jgi:hypothetical protein
VDSYFFPEFPKGVSESILDCGIDNKWKSKSIFDNRVDRYKFILEYNYQKQYEFRILRNLRNSHQKKIYPPLKPNPGPYVPYKSSV